MILIISQIIKMNNKHELITNKQSKLIVINSNQLEHYKASSKMFRSWKKPIKTFNINNHTPKFIDQNHIKTQFKDWVNKMNDSRKMENSQSSKTNDFSSKKLYQIINQIRQDEKLVIRDWSAEQKVQKLSRKKASSSIKINLQEVQRMKSTFENTKVILSPKDFQVDINERPSTTFGYRPIQSRFQKHFISKKNLNNSQHQKKRCLTQRKQLFTIDSYEKYLQSPTTPMSTAKGESSHYINKSKIKKIWETMGLHQWNNIN